MGWIDELDRDYRTEMKEATALLADALVARGFCYETKLGDVKVVRFRDLTLRRGEEGVVGRLVVDTSRLPDRVSIPRLASEEVRHHLQAVVGRRLRCLNTTGLAWEILFDPPRVEAPEAALPSDVPLRLEDRPGGRLMVPLGVGASGPVWQALERLDAVLVGGARRMGKSMWVNAAIAALVDAHGPHELRLALVDPKEVELFHWAGLEHCLGVAEDLATAGELMGLVMAEMADRKARFRALGARNLAEHNARAEPLPAILVVVDELADLVAEAGGLNDPAIRAVQRVVAKGGAYGVHAVLSTQLPDSDTIPRFLKANVATRLSFWLPSDANYRTVLQPSAGERFPRPERVKGRLVARTDRGWLKLQGYDVPDLARFSPGGVPALSEAEAWAVRWALTDNGGHLSAAELARRVGLSDWKARRLSEAWEARGWLEKDPENANKRRVTARLEALTR